MTLERQLGIIINLKKIRLLIKKIELFCLIRKANPYRRMQKALEQKVIMKIFLIENFMKLTLVSTC